MSQLNWDSLENCRLFAQAAFFYKISNNLLTLTFHLKYSPMSDLSEIILTSLKKFSLSVLAYNSSFYPRTVRTWNLLPTKVAGAPTLESFKSDALPAIRSIRQPRYQGLSIIEKDPGTGWSRVSQKKKPLQGPLQKVLHALLFSLVKRRLVYSAVSSVIAKSGYWNINIKPKQVKCLEAIYFGRYKKFQKSSHEISCRH